MIITFKRDNIKFKPLVFENSEIETVSCTKVLGVNISNYLKWVKHIDKIVCSAGKKITNQTNSRVRMSGLALLSIRIIT